MSDQNLHTIILFAIFWTSYHNDSKLLDRQVWANNADQDQAEAV